MTPVATAPEVDEALSTRLRDLALVDLLAGSGIVRPERNPGGGRTLVSVSDGIVGEEPRYQWR